MYCIVLYCSQDDPVAVAVVKSSSKLWGQLVLINVPQQICDRAEHHHLNNRRMWGQGDAAVQKDCKITKIWGCNDSYWHFEHEVLLTKAEAEICDGTLEEAGRSQHQHQVKVSREWGLRQREMKSAWQTHKDRPP